MSTSADDTTYDAIVIGSGISGGWAAKELCEKSLELEKVSGTISDPKQVGKTGNRVPGTTIMPPATALAATAEK